MSEHREILEDLDYDREAYHRRVDQENEQRAWEEEERRDKMLRGEPFFGDPDLYRDMRRGK